EVLKESVEEALDHSKKLKGIETLSAIAQLIIWYHSRAGEEEPVDDQDRTEQVRGVQVNVQVPELAVPNPCSSLTLSFAKYGNQFLNENPDVLITDILKDATRIKIQSMVDIPIHQEDPVV
ncbi:hypothetical protein Tco_1267924, partial [Tanacetum coccineum]